jgi:small subunit ribosomal protein S11
VWVVVIAVGVLGKNKRMCGVLHVKASYNNTIVSLTTLDGACLTWCSSGSAGFKGSRRATAFAALVAGDAVGCWLLGRSPRYLRRKLTSTQKAEEKLRQEKAKLRRVVVYIRGVGEGREAAVRGFAKTGVPILRLCDVTPLPHNGCRPPKARRI